jgi:hypothetical protein
MAMFTVVHDGHDWDEYLTCEVCNKAFTVLERAWLAHPVEPTPGARVKAIWAHKTCLEGCAQIILGTSQYQLRRADFVFRRVIQRLMEPVLYGERRRQR